MVNIGIMKANHLLIEALYESSELIPYEETDAAADAQWHPLDSIARDCITGKIKERAARALFKKALDGCDFLYETQNLSLDDVIEGNSAFSDSIQELRSNAWECCQDSDWSIFTDGWEALTTGTSMDPFEIVDLFSSNQNNLIVIKSGFIYFLSTDNVSEGWEIGQTINVSGKQYPVHQVTLLPEPDTVIGSKSPTYGPPKEIMEILAINISEARNRKNQTYEQIIKEAERGW